MKKKSSNKDKINIKKHLKEDIHESKESISDDKKLLKKMKGKKSKKSTY